MPETPYQVLARKWRPQRFAQVVGQSAIVRTLSNALDQGRIAHAYCFSGIRGVGKTSLARLLAKGLNCRSAEAPTSDPCGECEACREIEESRNLDVIEMDAASQTGVDDIRQLNEFARYTPSRDRHRVFIIDEAHMLSKHAFNALLKTLEEPPPHVVFVLATTEPHEIPQTVLSRCQQYAFGRISQAEIIGRLQEIAAAEKVKISADSLALVAMAADGSLRDAQSLLDKIIAFASDEVDDDTVVELLGMVDRELLHRVTDLIAQGDLNGVLELVNQMVEQGVDLVQFTLDFLGHLRSLLVVSSVENASAILHLPEDDLERLRRQAGRFQLDDLDRAFALLSASEYRIKHSEVPRYHLEAALARLARMPQLEPLEVLIDELRGGSSGSTPPAATSGSGGERHSSTSATAHSSARPPSRRPAVAGEPQKPPAQAAAAAGDHLPDSNAPPVARILERLRECKPVIAKILERAQSVELRDDTLWLSFAANGGIFKERLHDRSALSVIEKEAEIVLGRHIRVMTGFQQQQPESGPAIQETHEPADAANVKRQQLWQRAEQDAAVRSFVDALQGNLTEVEEA
ncbi:MAG: DNA polymerase III subunit gamma/tau [Acidobacteriota bacterium]